MPRMEVFSPKALKRARARAAFTLDALSQKSGISIQQINRYEKGHVVPREITVLALADALEIDPDDLYVEE